MDTVNPSENKNIIQENEAYLSEAKLQLTNAVEAITGSRDTDPLTVFPSPGEVRADGPSLELSAEQEAAVREAAGWFGIGGEVDIPSDADHQIIEGGKPWKVMAELSVVTDVKTLIFSGSPYRTIGQDETDFLATKLPEGVEPATTEFDMVRQVVQLEADFKPLEKDTVLSFGYDIDNGNTLVAEETDQLTQVGKLKGADVVLLRVDRKYEFDDAGQPVLNDKGAQKFYQPSGADLMGIVSDVLAAAGDEESSVGFNTSNTYAAKAIATRRAGLKADRSFVAGMYARQALADAQGKDVASPPELNQVVGELKKIHDELLKLDADLHG